jgi:hypothetical protein
MLIAFVVLTILIALAWGFVLGVYAERRRGIPLWQLEDCWSIGVYSGRTPLEIRARENHNPVLTRKSVTDVRAAFVADPFMVRTSDEWFMFFEVMPASGYIGKIGVARSGDGRKWKYERIVLEEPFHLSYPYVFPWQNSYYMIPDVYGANAIRLYQALEFPWRWSLAGELIAGNFVDASVVHHEGRWWLFAAEAEGNCTLRLFSSPTLSGDWAEHPMSPIVRRDPHIARPGGRVTVTDGMMLRFAQDDAPEYGNKLHVFEVTELTPTNYKERPAVANPLLTASGSGWNAHGMHHIDPHRVSEDEWIACVDGNQRRTVFRLKY